MVTHISSVPLRAVLCESVTECEVTTAKCILWMMLAISFALISRDAFAQGRVHSGTPMI